MNPADPLTIVHDIHATGFPRIRVILFRGAGLRRRCGHRLLMNPLR